MYKKSIEKLSNKNIKALTGTAVVWISGIISAVVAGITSLGIVESVKIASVTARVRGINLKYFC